MFAGMYTPDQYMPRKPLPEEEWPWPYFQEMVPLKRNLKERAMPGMIIISLCLIGLYFLN